MERDKSEDDFPVSERENLLGGEPSDEEAEEEEVKEEGGDLREIE